MVATAETITTEKEEQLPPVNFKGNVAKDKEIFTKKGTFFKLANTNENARRNMELSKLNAPFETISKKGGYKLRANIYADKTDLIDNIEIAKIVMESQKVNIDIRPHLDGHLIKNQANPEYLINSQLGERKSPVGTNYNNVLRKANKQGCEIVIIDLKTNKDTLENALKKVDNILRFEHVHPSITEVYIIDSNNKVEVYKRKKQS